MSAPTPLHPLARCLGVPAVLFLTLSAATPASSLFIIVPGMLAQAGTGTLVAFLLASLVCVATAFVYAELSSAFPIAGGEYVMVGRTLGPLAGFVVLGVNLVNNVLFPPVVGLGVSAVLASVVPGLPQIPVAIAVVAGSALCGVFGIRLNAWVTSAFLMVELAALAVVTWLGLAEPVRPLLPLLTHPAMPMAAGLAPASAGAIGVATTVAIFALNGYGMAVYFGEEMHDAESRIARVILLSFGLTALLEIVPIAAALMGAPDLPAMLRADDPFGLFVAARGGSRLADAVAIGVAIAIVNAAIVAVLASARFLYATARDGSWGPGIGGRLGAIHPRFASPWVASLTIGAVGIAFCFVDQTFVLILSGGGLIASYAAISFAALAGRRTGATAHARYRMPLGPTAPIVVLAALAYVVWISWGDVAEGRPGILATLAQMAVAATFYWLVLRPRGWRA